jgi:TolA-binding protein
MANTKKITEDASESVTPLKEQAIIPNELTANIKSVDEQIAEYQAKIKELQSLKLNKYNAELITVEARAKELRKLISDIEGIPYEHSTGYGGKPKAEKTQGKQVTASRLKELIEEANGELNIRKGGYDTAQIKKLVADNPTLFNLGPKGPWPTVSLVR